MEIRKIYLKDEFKNIKTDAYITIYSSSSNKFDENRSRKGILVIPGGGYNHLSVRENEPICLTFLKEDFVVASLTYTVNELDEFTPIDEGLASLAILRRHAKELHLDVNNISVLGFSAGGHLASSLALFKNDEKFITHLESSKEELDFKLLLLGYPVIDMYSYTHQGTMGLRTGNNDELKEKYSIQKHVDSSFPPTFIFLTSEDQSVNPTNSLLLAQELIKNHVRVELHMYEEGPHGLALGTKASNPEANKEYPSFATWVSFALDFINRS